MSRMPIHYNNYEQHPRQRSFLVFYFYAKATADDFEKALTERDIPFERGAAQDLVRRHLFGVHEQYEVEAKRLNNEVSAFHRKPFLSDKQFRIGVLIFTLVVTLTALTGWFLSQ